MEYGRWIDMEGNLHYYDSEIGTNVISLTDPSESERLKLVIDIDENVFTRLFDNGTEDYEISNDDLSVIARAVRNGTPLPKGHGDLIDRNELEECKELMNTITGESKYAVRMDDIRNMPTIIEADKEGTDE